MSNFKGRGGGALRLLRWPVLAAVLGLFAACFGLLNDLEGLGFGGLTILVTEDLSRNIIPAIDMTAACYDVSCTGPEGAVFFRSFTGSPIALQGLVFGSWAITVEGRNAGNKIVTRGEANVQVVTGTTRMVDITLNPVVGPGTLDLAVTWDPTSVDSPSVQSQLVPSGSSPIDLAFTLPSPGRASFSDDAVPNGYYTLVVKLLDNGQLVMGAVDIVRIVAGETTSGTIDFTDVNRGTGTISVSITLQMNEPVQVTMRGQATPLSTGHPMTVTASISPELGNATYVWYLNGISAGMGSSITMNSTANPLSPRTYRLDVCAFIASGSRGGSTTCTFEVVPPATQVTLEWDPNTESDLAGYRMYVGTASGVYSQPIDVGLVTTYTVTNLLAGRTYYFAVTARNASGMESGKSNEVSYTTP